jgi:hypothetical protein
VLVACYHRAPTFATRSSPRGPELGVLEAAAVGRVDLLRAHLSEDSDALDERTPGRLHAAAPRRLLRRRPRLCGCCSPPARPPTRTTANPPRRAPLHSAVAAGDREAVRALLEAGADPNVRQQGGFTPCSRRPTPTIPR